MIVENASEPGRESGNSLDHVDEQWSQLTHEVDIERLPCVADGTMVSPVSATVRADVETESFENIDESVAWAQDV